MASRGGIIPRFDSAMKYWRRIAFDYEPAAAKLRSWVQNNPSWQNGDTGSWKDLTSHWVKENLPELAKACQQQGWDLDYTALFVSSYRHGAIHVDADVNHHARILFPVWNTENTYTRFHVCSQPPSFTRQPNGVSWLRCDSQYCTMVDQLTISQGAVVFRNDQPHQVVSENSQNPRVTCTVAVKQDLTYLLDE